LPTWRCCSNPFSGTGAISLKQKNFTVAFSLYEQAARFAGENDDFQLQAGIYIAMGCLVEVRFEPASLKLNSVVK
jgi:hypothetical protein